MGKVMGKGMGGRGREGVFFSPTTGEIEKINSKHKEAIKKFIMMEIENQKLTVRKFCDAKGIPYQPLDHLLIKYPIIWETILSETQKRYHLKSLDVDVALYNEVLKRDPRAIELWYRHHEKWLPTQESPVISFQRVFTGNMDLFSKEKRMR